MTEQSQCETRHLQFRVIDHKAFEEARSLAQSGVRLRENMVDKTFIIGNRALAAAGTEDGSEGCVTIHFFGIPVRLCWEFQELSISFPGVSAEIKLTASAASIEYSGIMKIHCPDITQPAGCQITFTPAERGWFDPDCDWGCLRNCSPGCISCGSNYWCWAGCAVACVARCCSF
jgi:hypothetical protein